MQPRVWLIIPYERISWNVFPILPVSLHAKNQCDSIIRWGGICDQRILQSIRLKVFPVTTQEQEFSLIWDLCSKIDNNNSFYLRTFPVKINHKIFKIMKKPCFWVTFDHFFIVFTKREFLLKIVARYNYSGPSAFKCQKWRVDWQSNQKLFISSLSAYKNHSINLLNSSNHLWDIPYSIVPWSIRSCPFLTIPSQ